MRTVAPATKPEPVIRTAVPPSAGPVVGVTVLTTIGAKKVSAPAAWTVAPMLTELTATSFAPTGSPGGTSTVSALAVIGPVARGRDAADGDLGVAGEAVADDRDD